MSKNIFTSSPPPYSATPPLSLLYDALVNDGPPDFAKLIEKRGTQRWCVRTGWLLFIACALFRYIFAECFSEKQDLVNGFVHQVIVIVLMIEVKARDERIDVGCFLPVEFVPRQFAIDVLFNIGFMTEEMLIQFFVIGNP